MADPQNQSGKRVGIELSRSSINSVVIDEAHTLISSAKTPLTDDEAVAGVQIAAIVEELRRSHENITGLGVAVPGLVNRATGRVTFSANVPSHSEIDLVTELRSSTGLNVVIENDANAAAYSEFLIGAGRGVRNMFYATLGDGVGGAFIFDGEIWRGAAGFAGEFGYMTINSEGMRLEEVASAANIIRRTRSRFHQDSTSSLSKMNEDSIDLEAIIKAAKNDDDFAQLMLERTGTYVGTAIAGVIDLLNIERIVIGGKIMQAKHLVLNAITERARELAFAPSFESTTIVEGELGGDAPAIGAALLS